MATLYKMAMGKANEFEADADFWHFKAEQWIKEVRNGAGDISATMKHCCQFVVCDTPCKGQVVTCSVCCHFGYQGP